MTLSQLLAAPDRHPFLSGAVTDLTGDSVSFSGADALSFSLSEGGSGFLLGGAFSAACSLTLYDRDGGFTAHRSLYGAQVAVYLNEGEQRAPLCVFTVSKITRRENDRALTLSGSDALGTAFQAPFQDDFSYPLTLAQLAQGIAAQAGFSLTDSFPNARISIPSRPDWGEISLRQALAYAACAAGCFAWIDRAGALHFKPVWPAAPAFSIVPTVTLRREYGDSEFGPLAGLTIACKGAPRGAPPLTVQTPGSVLTRFNSLAIAQNPLFPHGAAHAQALADGLLSSLNGMRLTQARVTWLGDPALALGDAVRVTDTQDQDTVTLVTRQSITFSQGFSMQTDCGFQPAVSTAGRLFTPAGALNAAMLSGSVDGALLRAGSVAADALIAGSVSAQQLAAGSVQAAHLSAGALQAVDARIADADIAWAHVKDLATDTAIISQGVGGKLYIARLAVTEANLVSLTVGELLVRGQDGGFYAVSVDSGGQITAQRKQIVNSDVTDLSINADTKLIEGSVTAKTLNAQSIFADSALIRQLIAAHLDVDTLFARSATVQALTAADISGNQSLRLYVGQAMSALEGRTAAVESAILQKADAIELSVLQSQVDAIAVGGRNLLLDSGTAITNNNYNMAYYWPSEILREGEQYTVTLCVTPAANVSDYRLILSGGYYTNCALEVSGTEKQIVSKTFTAHYYPGRVPASPTDPLARAVFYRFPNNNTVTADSTIHWAKLETGNQATDWSPAPEDPVKTLDNTSVRIDASGVSMRGGAMDFQAGSAFRVRSGGKFNVFAADDESQIIFGGTEQNPNFSLGAGGTVKAANIITDQLTVKQTDLVSAAPGSLASRIVVSTAQPAGHGILWFCPNGVSTLDYILDHSAGEDMSGQNPSATLAGFTRRGSALAGSACTYGIKLRIFNYSGACTWYRVRVQIRRADGVGSTLTIYDATPNRHIGLGDYFSVNTLNAPSAALENLTAGGAMAVIVTLWKDQSTYARFEVDENFVLRCTNSSSQSAQSCDVRFLP